MKTIAAVRIGFEAWMASLPARDRRIARKLAVGKSTSIVAKLFRLCTARISQLRRELMEKWLTFQGETPQLATAAARIAHTWVPPRKATRRGRFDGTRAS